MFVQFSPVSRLVRLTRLGATANGVFFSIQLLQPILPFRTLKFDCIFSIEWSSYKKFWNVPSSNNCWYISTKRNFLRGWKIRFQFADSFPTLLHFPPNNTFLTRIHWLDRRIVRKQLDIMPWWCKVEKMAKNLNLGNFDNFKVKYLQIWIFSEK